VACRLAGVSRSCYYEHKYRVPSDREIRRLLVSGLVAEMFGTRYMATLLGIAFVMHQVGSSLGAWGGGLIFDVMGSYDRAWQIGVLVGLTAGIVQIFAGGPTRRRDRLIEPRFATT